jgi:outer membrane protein OmpA-like peptidoglycan-associated protein
MKKTPLHFTIPIPCKENYAAMEKKAGGSYCNKCSNIIYDFSQMTDVELVQYFKKYPHTHCGRFHTSQLNTAIEAVNIKHSFTRKLSKIAASVLALVTFKFSTVKASIKTQSNIVWQQSENRQTPIPLSDSIFISGVITNGKGSFIKNATITFLGKQVAVTDERGYYQFKIAEAIETNLYFNCDGYNTNVRNYNPAMGNAVYNVVLNEHGVESTGHTMGIISLPYYEAELSSISFYNSKTIKLSRSSKSRLDAVALELKRNPTATILLQGYCSKATNSLTENRIEKIRQYLIEQQGISIDRIITNTELRGPTNTIDLKFQ